MDFQLTSACNPVLALGVRKVDVIMTVTGSGAGEATVASKKKRVFGFVEDNSGSMDGEGKMQNANDSVCAGIDELTAEDYFFVISFDSSAKLRVPLTLATPAAKRAAREKVQQIQPDGGTAMSKGLLGALREFEKVDDAIKFLYFLTDGKNEGETRNTLLAALDQCDGKFQCNCGGIGTGWVATDLRAISDRLLGTSEAITDPRSFTVKLKAAIALISSKGASDIAIRVQTPKSSKLVSAKLVNPEIIDYTSMIKIVDDKNIDIPVGAWGNESRDYHLVFDLEPQPDGEQMMVCVPKVVDGATVTPFQRIVVQWSSNEAMTAQIDPMVAHYTGQAEYASALRDGIAAQASGDNEQATVLFGRAAKIAAETGNEGGTILLKRIVDIDDAEQGTVRLKKTDSATKAALLDLEMGSGATVRLKRNN